jgi:hypothetical protein
MRCTECGMPLSPSRTQCPRCGAPKHPAGKVRLSPHQSPAPTVQPVFPPIDPNHSYVAQPEQTTTAWNDATIGREIEQEYIPSTPPPAFQQPTDIFNRSTQVNLATKNIPPRHRQPRTRLGFTVAGMCFISGTLLMLLVYIMAQSLPQNTATAMQAAPVSTPQSQPTASASPTNVTPTPVVPTPTPTSTNNQAYISNIQLASAVNTATGEPLTETTVFHVGQPVYVTVTLNQSAYNGAICLNWSVNNSAIPYSTLIGNSGMAQTNAYFYFKPSATGQGQVDVSWASSTACTDEAQTQQEAFTVVP